MSNSLSHKLLNRNLRKNRVRAKVNGTPERPRLSVVISNMHVSKTKGTMTEKCALIGTEIAKKAKKAKINAVVFDRNGRQYAGRLKALADAARKEGLEF